MSKVYTTPHDRKINPKVAKTYQMEGVLQVDKNKHYKSSAGQVVGTDQVSGTCKGN